LESESKQLVFLQSDRPTDIPPTTPVIEPVAELMPEPGLASPSMPLQVAFQCRICGQVFTNEADLAEHMLSHNDSQVGGAKSEKRLPAGVA
jgi:hypothetical protein